MKNVIGGIGDFLQIVETAKKEDQISVYTHQSWFTAESFFGDVGIECEIERFDSIEDLESFYKLSYETPLDRELYPHISLPERSSELINNFKENRGKEFEKVTVGVHPFGSDFSNKYWGDKGMPTKVMPFGFVDELTSSFPEYQFLVFGEESQIGAMRGQINATFISCYNIWDSLAYVTLCDLFVGVDSAFKTMAVMSNVPTTVIMGDYEDEFRDDNFITPYQKDGILFPIRFHALTEAVLDQIRDRMYV